MKTEKSSQYQSTARFATTAIQQATAMVERCQQRQKAIRLEYERIDARAKAMLMNDKEFL